jgi:putative transposase
MLEQQLEECRWVYNETLAYRKRAYEEKQRTANWYETKRLLPDWKAIRSSLKRVHSQVFQNVTERVDIAFRDSSAVCEKLQKRSVFPASR